MSELALTSSESAALHGTTDSVTGVAYPAQTENWAGARARADARLIEVAKATNQFRVFEVTDNADAVGVRAGRALIDSEICSYAGEDPAVDSLTDNDTTYIWAESDGSNGITIDSAIDGTGWPTDVPHIKLAEVTMASGVITGIVDRRPESLMRAEVAYTLSINTQGDTGSASRIHIQGKGSTDFLRVRVCNDGAYADSTNATIAAAGNTSSVETHTSTKDLTLQSHTNGLFEIDLTNGTAETVTLRIGPPLLTPSAKADYSATLDVTHAAP